MKNEILRTEFLRIYANLPLGIRSDIIAVLEGEPMTWRVCYIEVKNNTKMADKIVLYLRELNII